MMKHNIKLRALARDLRKTKARINRLTWNLWSEP